jgi:hypothetical protein
MKVLHEICLDHDSSDKEATAALMQRVYAALGHGPEFRWYADSPKDTVHGRIIEMRICDTRLLGSDILEFRDGSQEVASADNIARWFEELGHRLVRIEGNKAFGNTLVHLQVTENAEAPNAFRKTTLARSTEAPSEEEIRRRLDTLGAIA